MYSYIIIPGASYEGMVWFAVLRRKGFKGLTEDSTSFKAPQLAEPFNLNLAANLKVF